jgi:arylsulfatase A-like enzyme
MSDDVVTLAEVLKRHGYTTAAFTEGGYAKGDFGLDQGFDSFPRNPGDDESHDSHLPSQAAWRGISIAAYAGFGGTRGNASSCSSRPTSRTGPIAHPRNSSAASVRATTRTRSTRL